MIKKLSTMVYTLLFLALSVPLLHSMEDPEREGLLPPPMHEEVVLPLPVIPGYAAGETAHLAGIMWAASRYRVGGYDGPEARVYCYDSVNHVYHLDQPHETSMGMTCGPAALYCAQRLALKLATNPQASFLVLTQYFYDPNPAFDPEHPVGSPSLYDPEAREVINNVYVQPGRDFNSKLTPREPHYWLNTDDMQGELDKKTLFPANIRDKIFLYSELMAKVEADDQFLAQRKLIQKSIEDPKAYSIFIYGWKPDDTNHWCTIAVRSTGKDGPLETIVAEGMRWAVLSDWQSGPDTSFALIHKNAIAPMNIVLFRSFLTQLHANALGTGILQEVKNATSSKAKADRAFKSELKVIFDQIPDDITLEQLTTTPTFERVVADPAPEGEGWDPRHARQPEPCPIIKRLQVCIETLYPNPLYRELQKAWALWAHSKNPGLSAEGEGAAERAIEVERKRQEEEEDTTCLGMLPTKCMTCSMGVKIPLSLPCGNLFKHATSNLPAHPSHIFCYQCTIDELLAHKKLIPNESHEQFYSFMCTNCTGFLSYPTFEYLLHVPLIKRSLVAYACAKYHGLRYGNLYKKKYLTPQGEVPDEGRADEIVRRLRETQAPRQMRIQFAEIGGCSMQDLICGRREDRDDPMACFIDREAELLLTQLTIAATDREERFRRENIDPDGAIKRNIVRDITPALLNDLFAKRPIFYGKIDEMSAPISPEGVARPAAILQLTSAEKTLVLLVRLYQCDKLQNQPVDSLKNLILHGNVYGKEVSKPPNSDVEEGGAEEVAQKPGLSNEEMADLIRYFNDHSHAELVGMGDDFRMVLDEQLPPWAATYRVKQPELLRVHEIFGEISVEKNQQLDQIKKHVAELRDILGTLRSLVASPPPPNEDTLNLFGGRLGAIIEELMSLQSLLSRQSLLESKEVLEEANTILVEAQKFQREKFPDDVSPESGPKTPPKPDPKIDTPKIDTYGPGPASSKILKLKATIRFASEDETEAMPDDQERTGIIMVADANQTVGSIVPNIATTLGVPLDKILRLEFGTNTNPLTTAVFQLSPKKISEVAPGPETPVTVKLSVLNPKELTAQPILDPKASASSGKLAQLKTALQQLQAKLATLSKNLLQLKRRV